MTEMKMEKIKLSIEEISDQNKLLKGNLVDFTLNFDCLRLIFELLPIVDRVRLERVSRLWYKASRASWSSFHDLICSKKCWGDLNYNTISDEILRKVLHRCSSYITSIQDEYYNFDHEFESIKPFSVCYNVTSLQVDSIKLDIADFRLIADNFKNMHHFSFGRTTENVTDYVLVNTILAECKNLKQIEIRNNEMIDGSFIEYLPLDTQDISLDNCFSMHTDILNQHIGKFQNLITLMLSATMSVLSSNFNFECLQTMNLRGLDISHNCYLIDDEALHNISRFCRKLTNVILDNNHEITDSGLAAISALPNLTRLSIVSLQKITEKAFSQMPLLTMLNCSNCRLTDNGLIQVLKQSQYIEDINCSECIFITKNFILAATNIVKSRNNSIPLKIHLSSKFDSSDIPVDSPLLILNFLERSVLLPCTIDHSESDEDWDL